MTKRTLPFSRTNEARVFDAAFAEYSPTHNTVQVFTRSVVGPMDYTPGAMINSGEEKNFAAIFERPMSLGTRCHQLAMYVIYESPLQMLADKLVPWLIERFALRSAIDDPERRHNELRVRRLLGNFWQNNFRRRRDASDRAARRCWARAVARSGCRGGTHPRPSSPPPRHP